MSNKFARKQIPSGHTADDFECFGPAAEKDGEFAGTMLCDMGCFTQDEVDSNKFYHGAVIQSKKDQKWYAYFEWGRVGNTSPDFQFFECSSKQEAIDTYEKQLHSKNDKRGEWYNHPVLGKMLRAKAGKDCYLVRPQTVRSTGLPSAKTITKITNVTSADATKKTLRHSEVESLLRDINLGTMEYAKSSMATNSIPTLEAIDEARAICAQAVKSKDATELKELSMMIYSRIPKTKRKGENWLLDTNNVKSWLDDLDSFEDALKSVEVSGVVSSEPFELEYIEHNSELGLFINEYCKKSSRNRHAWLPGEIIVKKIWKIIRSDSDKISKSQAKIASKKRSFSEKPIFIPERVDLEKSGRELYKDSNTHLLIHGTRSVNVGGILRQALKLPAQLKGVSINGAMFGGGLYFADDWRKSAGYTSLKGSYYSSGSGAVKNRDAFLFLADVVLGECHVPRYAQGFVEPPSGYDSVLGKADVSGVANNEFITYYTESNSLRYLVEFTTK